MPSKKLPLFLAALLCKATSSLAQSQQPPPAPPPEPSYQQVSVEVPRAVSLLTDVAAVLLSRDKDKDKVQALIDRRHARSAKGDQSLTVSIPKNKITRMLGLVE